MAGLGWQEIVIVVVILGIFLGVLAPPVFLIVRAVRHRTRHEALRERHRHTGLRHDPLYAGFWDRAGAAILDGLVLLVPVWAIQTVGQRIAGEPNPLAATVFSTLVWLAYLIIGNGRGATLGKRWAGLRIVDGAGAAPGLHRAAVRVLIPLAGSLLSWLSLTDPIRVEPGGEITVSPEAALPLLASLVIWTVDTLWMIWDPRKQTLHDKLAGTFVIVPR